MIVIMNEITEIMMMIKIMMLEIVMMIMMMMIYIPNVIEST